MCAGHTCIRSLSLWLIIDTECACLFNQAFKLYRVELSSFTTVVKHPIGGGRGLEKLAVELPSLLPLDFNVENFCNFTAVSKSFLLHSGLNDPAPSTVKESTENNQWNMFQVRREGFIDRKTVIVGGL